MHHNDQNNAFYQTDDSEPKIKVGKGDGEVLANMSTDADVVSHELFHH